MQTLTPARPQYAMVNLMSEGLKWFQCPVCKESIHWKLPEEELKQVKRFPAPIVIQHKDHYLICYLDSHHQLADTEIATAFVEGKSKE